MIRRELGGGVYNLFFKLGLKYFWNKTGAGSPPLRPFKSGWSLTFIFYQQIAVATKLNICSHGKMYIRIQLFITK